MELGLVWWHWIVGGIALVLFELMVPTFAVLWFGIGAVLVGVLLTIVGLNTWQQLASWAVASGLMTFLWFRYFKQPDRTRAGISKEAVLGEVGLVTKEVSELAKGEIRFQKPILGSEVWPIIADETIERGERARIIDVIGQTIKVARKPPQ